MAKKGQAVQLQTEVNSDEEWDKLLEREGLIVVDVYSDWCGPCSGMTANLKKLKLDIGGDTLQLAIAKSDHITALERFRNKSEPTWMFISHGKMVNLMFGASAPKLIRIVTEELKKENEVIAGTSERIDAKDIAELADEEQERYDIDNAVIAEAQRIENEKKFKALLEHRTAQAENILGTYQSVGAILVLPKAEKKYAEVLGELWADAGLNVSSKDKLKLSENMLEELLYFTDFTFPEDTEESILNGTCVALLIKPADEEVAERIDEAILQLIYGSTKQPPGAPNSPSQILMRPEERKKAETETAEAPEMTDEEKAEQKRVQQEEDEAKIKEGEIMALWAPPNAKTKAYALKVFFPNLIAPLILPEPEPIPPHLALVFDAFKRREVLEVMQQYPNDVMRFGFFTSEDPHKAKLIAKTPASFTRKLAVSSTRTEKMVIQLSKKRSEAFLAFAQLNPAYMSPNILRGEEECKLFFPEDYDIPEEGEEEDEVEIVETKKKPGKRRSKKSITSQEETHSVIELAEGEAPDESQPLDAMAEEGEGATEEGEKIGEDGQEEAGGEGAAKPEGEEGALTEEVATSPMTDEGAAAPEAEQAVEPPPEG